MTTFLALDTATDVGSVALGEPGRSLGAVQIPKRQHAAEMMLAIREVLGLTKLTFADLAGIVVADGPGSFTGLRIGFSTAKGIMRDYPYLALHTAPSLLCAAYGAWDGREGPVASMYDALRGEVYGAVYRFENRSLVCDLPPTLGSIAKLRDRCPTIPTIAVGDGAVLHRAEVRDWVGRDPVEIGGRGQTAASLLELLNVKGATRFIGDPDSLEPDYGRLAEAQVRLESAKQTPKNFK